MQIGETAPDFELPDLDGQPHTLAGLRGRIVIVNFWSCECPHAVRTDSSIMAWHQTWGEGVVLLAIASNAGETMEAIAAAARQRHLPFVLVDRQHRVADMYAALTTPQVFVVDGAGRLRYQGAVDDTSFSQRRPRRFFLHEAVQALLAGQSPQVLETRSYGCAIIREALE